MQYGILPTFRVNLLLLSSRQTTGRHTPHDRNVLLGSIKLSYQSGKLTAVTMMLNYSEGSIATCTCRFRRRVHQPLQQYEATISHYHRLPFIKHEVLVTKKFKILNLLCFVWFMGCEGRIQTKNVCEEGTEAFQPQHSLGARNRK